MTHGYWKRDGKMAGTKMNVCATDSAKGYVDQSTSWFYLWHGKFV